MKLGQQTTPTGVACRQSMQPPDRSKIECLLSNINYTITINQKFAFTPFSPDLTSACSMDEQVRALLKRGSVQACSNTLTRAVTVNKLPQTVSDCADMIEQIRTTAGLLQPDEVLRRFQANGTSVSQWAVERGFNPTLVYAVLKGGRRCLRGQSHAIAVALRLKAEPDDPVP
jgi:gp16 family phage-associated protein